MLIKLLEYSRFLRWLLPLLMAFPFLTREMHLLLVPHGDHQVCQDPGQERHVHKGAGDAEYCLICHFTFSSFEVPEDVRPFCRSVSFMAPAFLVAIDAYPSSSLHTYPLRGPPFDHFS